MHSRHPCTSMQFLQKDPAPNIAWNKQVPQLRPSLTADCSGMGSSGVILSCQHQGIWKWIWTFSHLQWNPGHIVSRTEGFIQNLCPPCPGNYRGILARNELKVFSLPSHPNCFSLGSHGGTPSSSHSIMKLSTCLDSTGGHAGSPPFPPPHR